MKIKPHWYPYVIPLFLIVYNKTTYYTNKRDEFAELKESVQEER